MKAVILSAGEGVHMRPLTATRPKGMIPLANKPILEHLVVALKGAGFHEILLLVGYKEEMVRGYLGNGERWGVKIEYVRQSERLCTGYAVSLLQSLVSGPFLLLNGDILVEGEDIRALLCQEDMTMGVSEVARAENLGAVEVGETCIRRIVEKPVQSASHLANAGLYLLTQDIFAALAETPPSPRGEYELTSALQWLVDHGHPIRYQPLNFWVNISYPWDLLTANEILLMDLLPENLVTVEEHVVIRGPVAMGKRSIIRSHSYITGPVVIGQNCDIGPNCYVRPCTAVGHHCHIGSAVEVKNSVILPNTNIPHHNYVGDSVIGENCNLGAGTKIVNLRLDKENIRVGSVDTRRVKLGAIIGDGVQTGINVSINEGRLIGDHAFIGPSAVARGIMPPKARVFPGILLKAGSHETN